LIIISRAVIPRIRVISGGSCDTDNWINDAENPEINYTLLYFTVENITF